MRLASLTVGDPIPHIQCLAGYTATLYAQGLSSPEGLAFSPSGVLHVAEETAGRVSRIEPVGSITTVVSSLTNPEWLNGWCYTVAFQAACHWVTRHWPKTLEP